MPNKEEQGTIECPSCGQKIDHLVQVGDSPSPSCPSCGRWIGKDKIPEGFPIEHREAEKEQEPEVIEEESEQETTPGMLRKPSEPHQILNKILSENDIGKDARAKLVRKCKRIPSGMHPDYLKSLLTKVKGGVKQRADASLIAEDYEWELEEAEEDFSELLSGRSRTARRREPRKSIKGQEVSRIDRMENKLEKLRQQKFESEKERIKEINRMEKKLLQSQIDQMRNEMQSMQQNFQQQLNQLESNRQRREGDYSKDEFRLIGESLDKLANVVREKDIADKILDSVERITRMPKGRPQQERREVEETESSKSSVPNMMIEAGASDLVPDSGGEEG